MVVKNKIVTCAADRTRLNILQRPSGPLRDRRRRQGILVLQPNRAADSTIMLPVPDRPASVETGGEVPPLVSVVIPAFNRPDYLRLAVGSVLAQTVADLELI